MNQSFLALSLILISGFSSASTPIYSLEFILRYAGQVGELKINDMGKPQNYKELSCGYAHTFESEEIIVDDYKVWSSSQLSKNQSYYVVSFDAEYEILALKERFNQSNGKVQEKLRQEFVKCLQYIRSFEIILLPETTFEIMLNAEKKYAQLKYSILNDTGITSIAILDCNFKKQILTEPIELKCLKVLVEDVLQKKHKVIYSQLFRNNEN